MDGAVVSEQGTRVDPHTAVIHVDGQRVVTDTETAVFAMNKPLGVLTTMADERGRPCVGDYTDKLDVRVFHVGRLDADTEGLLLLTNDGELANRLTHPTHGVAKTYLAEVDGPVKPGVLARLRTGVPIDGRPVDVDSVRVSARSGRRVQLELVIHEGRTHIVRRLLAEVGHPVQRLVRTRVGPINLGGQRPGKVRPLSRAETRELYTAAGL